MLWFHPVIQFIATLLGAYALYLGMDRFFSQHLGHTRQFNWKLHVSIGRIAIILWMAGLVGGMMVARLKWQTNFVTGSHYQTALAMIPFMTIGAVTGIYMDRKKMKRTIMPIIHGTCNAIALALAFNQIRTGWRVIQDFIL